jgi:alpha-aminoadipate carrier protein LysW
MSQLSGACEICDGVVSAPANTEQSEILLCPECKSRLVVEAISGNQMSLTTAPEVEEDWGE